MAISASGADLEVLVLNTQFVHAGSVQLPQETHDASLLPGAGRAVHQQMREVATLHLRYSRDNVQWLGMVHRQ